jgi:hypothetical protein
MKTVTIGTEYLDTQMSADQRVVVLEHNAPWPMAKVRLVGIGTVYMARVEFMVPSMGGTFA